MDMRNYDLSRYKYNGEEDEVSLHRDKLRNTLVQACKNINDPYVIAIKGNYGTGKTTFLRHLQARLGEESIATVWFDAWLSDHLKDPFSSLLASFDNDILGQYFEKEENRKELLELTKKYSFVVGQFSLKALGKFLAGTNATEQLAEALKDNNAIEQIIDETADALTSAFAKQFLTYKEAQRGFEDFAKQLTKTAKDLEDKEMLPKIVIFVDELDRCKPNYAIQILEIIKHFFDAENIIFILSICEEAMKGAVNGVYHPDVNYAAYMNKFVDMSFMLPAIPAFNYWQYMQEFDKKFYQLPEVIHQYLPAFIEGYDVSLRDQNRIFSALLFMFQIMPELKYNDDRAHSLLGLIYIFSLYVKDFPKEKKYEEKAFSRLLKIVASTGIFYINELREVFGYIFYEEQNPMIIKEHAIEYNQYRYSVQSNGTYDQTEENKKREEYIFNFFIREKDDWGDSLPPFPHTKKWLDEFKNLSLG